MKDLVAQYKPVGSKSTDIQLKIVLQDETPICHQPRRFAFNEKEEVNRQVEQWMADGVVRRSSSDFASGVVLVKKKDGSSQLCIDYRQVNKNIVQDRYPLPLIEVQLDSLKDARVFSTLDLKNGFFHIKVHEDSVKYTAFVTHSGQFEFLRMPFGLKNGPAMFMRFINAVFRELISEGVVLIYMDDLIVLSSDVEEGVMRLRRVLATASEFGLDIKWKKCQLLCKRVEDLGHLVEGGKIEPSVHKTEAVRKYPEPRNRSHGVF